MKDQYGFDIQCEHSDLRIVNENDEEEFVCTKGMFACRQKICYCNDKCSEYEPKNAVVEEIIDEMAEDISDMMIKNPIQWVEKAYKRAETKAQTHHVELDSCGREVWVRNESISEKQSYR